MPEVGPTEVESDAEFSVEAPETDYNSWKGRVFRKYVSDGLALIFLLKKAVFRYFNIATCSSPMPDMYHTYVGDENKGYPALDTARPQHI